MNSKNKPSKRQSQISALLFLHQFKKFQIFSEWNVDSAPQFTHETYKLNISNNFTREFIRNFHIQVIFNNFSWKVAHRNMISAFNGQYYSWRLVDGS